MWLVFPGGLWLVGMKTMLSGSAALRGARAALLHAPLCTSGSMCAKHGFLFLLC